MPSQMLQYLKQSPAYHILYHPPHWYNHHIKSYEKEKASLSGEKKALSKYGPANVEDTTGSGATDSKNNYDSDLFGSDEEEQSKQVKRLREEYLAQSESKKTKKTALCQVFHLIRWNLGMTNQIWQKKSIVSEAFKHIAWTGSSSKLVPVGYGI